MTWKDHIAPTIAGLFWVLAWITSWPGRGLGNLSMWCAEMWVGEVLFWLALVVSIPALTCLFLANLVDPKHDWS